LKANNFAVEVLTRLRSVLPRDREFIALHEPSFRGSEWEKVKNCLDTGWVSYAGEYVKKFDEMLASYCGIKHAICTSSGTAALHMVLKLIGVRENDEVLMPGLTFIASANAVSYMKALPHFVDSDRKTFGIDPAKLREHLTAIAIHNEKGECMNRETGRRISAIMPVHVFGHPCDMDEINAIAKEYNLKIAEDAEESFGSLYKKKQMVTFGNLEELIFKGNKIFTT
jgi:perosamine synthetase